jgi:hypothetical protein
MRMVKNIDAGERGKEMTKVTEMNNNLYISSNRANEPIDLDLWDARIYFRIVQNRSLTSIPDTHRIFHLI